MKTNRTHLSEAQAKTLTKRREMERRAARKANRKQYPQIPGLVTDYNGQEFLVNHEGW